MRERASSIAAQFVRSRQTAAALSEYPGEVPATLEDAYACQDVAISRWSDRLCGWKVARIAPDWQQRFPEERLIGPIFQRNFQRAVAGQSVPCEIFDGGFAAIEAEIGIVLRTAPPAGKTHWTSSEAAELVDHCCIGVEIASSPLATLNDLGPGAVISDFGNNWGAVAGSVIANWRQPRQLQCEAFIDAQPVGRGTVDFPAVPLAALAFALGKAARLGRPLQAGAYISTGMITGVHEVRSGARARLSFADCGEVLCHVVPATPIEQPA